MHGQCVARPFLSVRLNSRARRAKESNQPARDEFLRPMVDTTGIRYRIGFSEEEVTEEIREEFEENQQESWEGLRGGGGHPPSSPYAGCSMCLWFVQRWPFCFTSCWVLPEGVSVPAGCIAEPTGTAIVLSCDPGMRKNRWQWCRPLHTCSNGSDLHGCVYPRSRRLC